jgi:tetratricopeptide (TPR) repeat protein
MRRSIRVVAVSTAIALVGAGGAVGCKSRQSTPEGSRSTPVTRGSGPQATGLVSEADAALQRGSTEEALRLLAAAIEQNPELTVAHMRVGDIQRETGNYVEAEKSYRTAANLEPRNFDAQYMHGLTLHLLNKLGDAVRAYLRALAINPDDFAANLNLATAYLQLEEPGQGLAYAERAVVLNPSSGPAHANLGAIYAALDRHEAAVPQFQAAAELMELTPDLLVNLANSLGKLERYQEMINTLDAVVRIEDSAVARERLGFAHFKLRAYDRAAEEFRRSIDLDGRHYPAMNGLGVCLLNQYLASGRDDDATRRQAVELFRRSLRINTRQPKIVELLSRFG